MAPLCLLWMLLRDRAVARHCTAVDCRYNMSRMAGMWTDRLKQRWPNIRSMTLCGHPDRPAFTGPDVNMAEVESFLAGGGIGLEHIAAAYGDELEHLSITGLDPSDRDLEALATHATSIKRLSLRSSENQKDKNLSLTLEAISRMTSLTSLEIGALTGHLHDHDDLSVLQHLTCLETLECKLDFDTALPLLTPKLTNLRKLHLGSATSVRFLRPISQLQHLSQLTVRPPLVLMELMEVVAPIQSLREVWLIKAEDEDDEDDERAQMHPDYHGTHNVPHPPLAPQVSTMGIHSALLAPGVLKDMAKALPGLQYFDMTDCQCLAADLRELCSIVGLRDLIISSGSGSEEVSLVGPLPEPGLKGFPALQTLEMTGIDGTQLLPSGDISLLIPSTLEVFNVSFDAAPGEVGADDFVHAISAAPALKQVCLENVLRSDADASAEEGEKPDVAGSELSRRVFQALPSLPYLRIDDNSWSR